MFNPEAPPELVVTGWLGVEKPLSLAQLKGRVVALYAFQMLCPGCVSHALPQARKLVERFETAEIAVIGLHSVFEHHDAMTPAALKAFVHEYRWPFPIAIDAPGDSELPRTMDAYAMRGTPTLLLFDRMGRLRRHYLGQVDDMRLGAEIMAFATEPVDAPREFAVAVERALHAALREPEHDHHAHDHEHEHGPGCGHDHRH